MKKERGSSILFILATVYSLNASIQFPSTLGGHNYTKFNIEYNKPISAVKSNSLSSVTIQGDYFVNGYPLHIPSTLLYPAGSKGEKIAGFEGSIQFIPEISSSSLSDYLEHMSLDKVVKKGGYYDAYYSRKHENNSKKNLVLSTRKSGKLYQCPLPSEIHVVKNTKTPYVKAASLPACEGLTTKQCEKLKQTRYVHKNNIHYFNSSIPDKIAISPSSANKSVVSYKHKVLGQAGKSITPDLFNHVTNGKVVGENRPLVMTDISSPVSAKPLAWQVKKDSQGNDDLHTYTYEALCGDKVLVSHPYKIQEYNPIMEMPAAHHMGFKAKENEPFIDHEGTLVIPPLYATQFTKEDNKHVTMTCKYAHEDKPEEALILKMSLDVPVDQCFLYAKDAVTSREYKGKSLATYYTINKDITIVSQKGTKKEPAPVLHVVPNIYTGKPTK